MTMTTEALPTTRTLALNSPSLMCLPSRVLHVIVGFNADQYAAEMAGQLA